MQATRYALHHHRMLPPAFIYRPTLQNRGVVDAPGTALVDRERFNFVDACPPVGTDVVIDITRAGMFALSVAEVEAQRRFEDDERERLQRKEEARRREQADRDRAEAEAFNAALALPFAWSSAYKIHMAGLRQGGSCTGDFAKTVTHVRCDDAVAAGRLQRRAGTLLCGGRDTKLWLADDQMRDGSGELFDRKVTCRSCLQVAQRLTGKAQTA
jgi:hypothetical protein